MRTKNLIHPGEILDAEFLKPLGISQNQLALDLHVPAPRISRIEPRNVKAMVNPRPIPMPSNADAITPFLDANASARANMIQFTTIRGMNMPSDLLSSGAKPSIKN